MKRTTFLISILLCHILNISGQWLTQTGSNNIYYSNGNVGVGTELPSAKLDIGSSGDVVSESMLQLVGAKSQPENYSLRLEKVATLGSGYPIFDWQINQRQYNGNNGNLLTFYRNGNVGIGTTLPSAKLDIGSSGDIVTESMLQLVGAKSQPENYNLRIEKIATQGSGYPIFDWQINQRQYNGNNGNLLTFYRNGNIGMGIIEPLEKLDMYGRISVRFYKDFPAIKAIFGHYGNAGGASIIAQGANSTTLGSGDIRFITSTSNSANSAVDAPTELRMIIKYNGNVGVGIENPGDYKLNVWGRVRAHEIVVNTDGADFVFDPSYKLRSLNELETYIKEHKHLPEIAPAKEMQENGVSAGELQTKLLQKVEELTLYLIEKDKQIEGQNKIIAEQQLQLLEMKKRLEIIEKNK